MTTLESDQISRMNIDHPDESLEYLISIWPISTKVAAYLPAGDLISLSRSSKALRSYTHGFGHDFGQSSNGNQYISAPIPDIGEHQTQYWANLKALSPFVCSFPSHKEPKSAKSNPCKPCKFCSRPICKTCIVRSFFTDPKSSKSTYKYRARHLCPKCWDTGNLRKDFRFPADSVSREQVWKGRGYAQRGNWCGCSASEDNWVCGECRILQNTSGVSNDVVSLVPAIEIKIPAESATIAGESAPVNCYGLSCDIIINEIDRDRRRICLWCSKPLMRPYGGDDRLRWEEKQIEVRAAAAASRSADIHEWARNRFKSLTMSRREMRGTEACIALTGSDDAEHDQPIFVRHLDTINYRKYMSQRAAPSGDDVYQSKHGRWIYSRAFLSRFNRSVEHPPRSQAFSLPPGVNVDDLFLLNADMGLPGARTNSHIHFHTGPDTNKPCKAILQYGVRLQNASLLDQDCLSWLHLTPNELPPRDAVIGTETLKDKLLEYLKIWENLPEDRQVRWTPPSFWYIAEQAGLLEKKKEKKNDEDDEDDEGGGGNDNENKSSNSGDLVHDDDKDRSKNNDGNIDVDAGNDKGRNLSSSASDLSDDDDEEKKDASTKHAPSSMPDSSSKEAKAEPLLHNHEDHPTPARVPLTTRPDNLQMDIPMALETNTNNHPQQESNGASPHDDAMALDKDQHTQHT